MRLYILSRLCLSRVYLDLTWALLSVCTQLSAESGSSVVHVHVDCGRVMYISIIYLHLSAIQSESNRLFY